MNTSSPTLVAPPPPKIPHLLGHHTLELSAAAMAQQQQAVDGTATQQLQVNIKYIAEKGNVDIAFFRSASKSAFC